MVEYRILTDSSANDLAKRVEQALADGWQLQGGVSIAIGVKQNCFDFAKYAQAVIRTTVSG